MARPSIAARRYAEAVLELARRDGSFDRWLADLRLVADVAADPAMAAVLENRALPFPARRAVFEKILAGRTSPEALNLALLLAKRGRSEILPAVATEFKRLVDRERGVVAATISSAVPLAPAELEAIRARIREMIGADVELESREEPELIGGVSVRIGDRLIDASVRGRLERLRERLVSGAR
jgi:F-type H+-transporting ATPase subunit delta